MLSSPDDQLLGVFVLAKECCPHPFGRMNDRQSRVVAMKKTLGRSFFVLLAIAFPGTAFGQIGIGTGGIGTGGFGVQAELVELEPVDSVRLGASVANRPEACLARQG